MEMSTAPYLLKILQPKDTVVFFLLLLLFYTMLLQVAICSQNKMNGMGNHGWLANEDCKCSRKGLTPGRNRVKDLF